MVNRNSRAGHTAERTCVICRIKGKKKEMLRFIRLQGEVVFDLQQNYPARGYYICNRNQCLDNLSRWVRKRW